MTHYEVSDADVKRAIFALEKIMEVYESPAASPAAAAPAVQPEGMYAFVF